MAYLDILNRIGLLIGGSQPNAAESPYFYSGVQVGDGTGVQGIQGAYSIPPETLPDPPVALVLPDGFELGGTGHREVLMQGNEYNEDEIKIWLLLWRNDAPTQFSSLVPFRDLIPALFRGHMQLNGLTDTDAFVVRGHVSVMRWAGIDYLGWEFILRVRQVLVVAYSDPGP